MIKTLNYRGSEYAYFEALCTLNALEASGENFLAHSALAPPLDTRPRARTLARCVKNGKEIRFLLNAAVGFAKVQVWGADEVKKLRKYN